LYSRVGPLAGVWQSAEGLGCPGSPSLVRMFDCSVSLSAREMRHVPSKQHTMQHARSSDVTRVAVADVAVERTSRVQERDRQRQRQRDRKREPKESPETERQRDRETEREGERQRDSTQGEKDRETESVRRWSRQSPAARAASVGGCRRRTYSGHTYPVCACALHMY
jgi:hypothetical protein